MYWDKHDRKQMHSQNMTFRNGASEVTYMGSPPFPFPGVWANGQQGDITKHYPARFTRRTGESLRGDSPVYRANQCSLGIPRDRILRPKTHARLHANSTICFPMLIKQICQQLFVTDWHDKADSLIFFKLSHANASGMTAAVCERNQARAVQQLRTLFPTHTKKQEASNSSLEWFETLP
jgi:hypothetical protein